MQGRSDDELYSLYLSGNNEAYDELMLRYGDSVTVFLNGYLHNVHDAEDLMIEAFARIMVKKPLIKVGGFKAYLFKTARNMATRFHTTQKAAEMFSIDSVESLDALTGYSSIVDKNTPDKKLQSKEERTALYSSLENIDPELREAVWLVYFEDMTYAEAATVMDVKVKRIDYLLQRAKEILRQDLESKGMHRNPL